MWRLVKIWMGVLPKESLPHSTVNPVQWLSRPVFNIPLVSDLRFLINVWSVTPPPKICHPAICHPARFATTRIHQDLQKNKTFETCSLSMWFFCVKQCWVKTQMGVGAVLFATYPSLHSSFQPDVSVLCIPLFLHPRTGYWANMKCHCTCICIIYHTCILLFEPNWKKTNYSLHVLAGSS